ncbi:hypothetical protein Y032_0406g889 [Ancylostoma ceylanicum]|uniref:Uncharacterized protein n=1 Tax=Ancylostoma ceylanicum TaxID=53326 RepID=A0A016X2S1_9BILA|nr:hypothetical protein Y032_0406g889 [Ancylostoma ceylanicum]
MQYALVFFRESETSGVVSRSDVDGEFKLQAIVKARWEGVWYSAKILFLGSKRVCKSKVDDVSTSGQFFEDDFEISRLREESPSIASSNSSPPRSENGTIKNFCDEVISRMNELQNRMPAPAFEYDVRSTMRAQNTKMGEIERILRELLKRTPAPLETGELQFHFVSQEQVELIRKQKKCNKNLFALALEKEVYRNLQADLVVPVERRSSGDRVEFIKGALFKYYLVPEKCQVEVWRSARDAMNSRVRRTRKQLREAGELGSSEGSSSGSRRNRGACYRELGSERSEPMHDMYEFDDDLFD